MIWSTIFLSITLTLSIYLFIPIIFILIGKKHSLRFLKVLSITSCIIGYSIWIMLLYLSESDAPSFYVAWIWSYVGYRLMKKRILEIDNQQVAMGDKINAVCKTNKIMKVLNKMLLDKESILFANNMDVIIAPVSEIDPMLDNKMNGLFAITNQRIIFINNSTTRYVKFMKLNNIKSTDNSTDSIDNHILKIVGTNQMFIVDLEKEQQLNCVQALNEAIKL